MRESRDVFHLAIPSHDLDASVDFYVTGLGCHLARRMPDRITLDFFGDQVVCHLHDQLPVEPSSLYPRHFGVTFREGREFDALVELCRLRNLSFFEEPRRRFDGRSEAHRTFSLVDPTGNLLEFKQYDDPRMMY